MSKPPAQPGKTRRAGPVVASWADERTSERGDQRVLQGFAELRAERVYEEAVVCAACDAARKAEGPDALCEKHLGEALGMGGGWDLGTPGRKL